ncbi:YitT family protein [Shouchella shacheensis]|uniref:YitT family protein n=1 Tax=Shouchella shacheensis TaxID=1649580 RepID=UPI000A7265EC|nr:YitT family protein [Shouchella shacheensis]
MAKHAKNVLFILLGTAMMSFGLVYFNMAHNLADGGVTGITLLLFFLFSINPAISNLVINIPLFFIGWKMLGRTTFIYTLIGTLSLSVFLDLFQRIPSVFELYGDLMLAALFAGAIVGAGLGLVFRFGGTTGGADIIAKLCLRYFGWSIGRTFFVFDSCVIIVSLLYLELHEAMYTLVYVFIAAKVIDFIQQGAYSAKAAFVISERMPEISDAILREMGRGATTLQGKGTFTGADKEILYCVVARNEIIRFRNTVHKIDPSAFLTINDVQDVHGEGFTLDDQKKPLQDER